MDGMESVIEASNLLDMSSDCVGCLSEFLFSSDLMKLVLTGSKRLLSSLFKGVTSFRHYPTMARTYDWPSIVCRFIALRNFEAVLPVGELDTHAHLPRILRWVHLKSLPKTLESLSLDFENSLISMCRFSIHSSIADLEFAVLSDIPRYFPNLRKFSCKEEIYQRWTYVFVPTLFDSLLKLPLTDLHLPLSVTVPLSKFASNYHQYESLSFSAKTETPQSKFQLPELPPGIPCLLTTLTIGNFPGWFPVKFLPRTVTSLKLHLTELKRAQLENASDSSGAWDSDDSVASMDGNTPIEGDWYDQNESDSDSDPNRDFYDSDDQDRRIVYAAHREYDDDSEEDERLEIMTPTPENWLDLPPSLTKFEFCVPFSFTLTKALAATFPATLKTLFTAVYYVDGDALEALPRSLEEWCTSEASVSHVSVAHVARLPPSLTSVNHHFFHEQFVDVLPPRLTQATRHASPHEVEVQNWDLLPKMPKKLQKIRLSLARSFSANPLPLPLRIPPIPLTHLTHLTISIPEALALIERPGQGITNLASQSRNGQRSPRSASEPISQSPDSTKKRLRPAKWFDQAFMMDIGKNLPLLTHLNISSCPIQDPAHLDYLTSPLVSLKIDCDPEGLNLNAKWAEKSLQELFIICSDEIYLDQKRRKRSIATVQGGTEPLPNTPLAYTSKHKKRRPIRKRTMLTLLDNDADESEDEEDDRTLHFANDILWPETLTKLRVQSTNFVFPIKRTSFPPKLRELKLSLSIFPIKLFKVLPDTIDRIYGQIEEDTSAKAFLRAIRSLPQTLTILDVIGSDKVSEMVSGYGKLGIEFREWIENRPRLASLGLDLDEQEAASRFWPSRQFKHVLGVSYPFQLGSQRTTPSITRNRDSGR